MIDIFRRSLRVGITTTSYPEVEQPAPPAFRGQVVLDTMRCTGEAACAAACPSQAITVEHLSPEEWVWQLHDSRCVFCGLCADACPTGAISLTNEFELAVRDPSDLITEVIFKPATTVEKKDPESA